MWKVAADRQVLGSRCYHLTCWVASVTLISIHDDTSSHGWVYQGDQKERDSWSPLFCQSHLKEASKTWSAREGTVFVGKDESSPVSLVWIHQSSKVAMV